MVRKNSHLDYLHKLHLTCGIFVGTAILVLCYKFTTALKSHCRERQEHNNYNLYKLRSFNIIPIFNFHLLLQHFLVRFKKLSVYFMVFKTAETVVLKQEWHSLTTGKQANSLTARNGYFIDILQLLGWSKYSSTFELSTIFHNSFFFPQNPDSRTCLETIYSTPQSKANFNIILTSASILLLVCRFVFRVQRINLQPPPCVILSLTYR